MPVTDTARSWDTFRAQIFPKGQRRPSGLLGGAIALAGAGLCLITLYWGFRVTPGPFVVCYVHLAVMIPLTFLLYPASRRPGQEQEHRPTLLDSILAFVSLVTFTWGAINADRFETRLAYSADLSALDIILGILAVILVFEATRRTVGLIIVIVTSLFIIYALSGPHWPSIFEHRGTTIIDLVETTYMLQTGMVNFIVEITATFVFTFIAFGVFLQVSGGIRIFTDLALALAGHRRGGPAKVAIVSSALMGTLSGSTMSNVVTTGSLTIPMMKKIGFKPHESAAIETCASLGGALTPPMMGAGVLVMSAFTGIPLITLLAYSVLPAFLYYTSLYYYVDIKARKANMIGLPQSELPRVRDVLLKDGHIFLPVVALVVLLIMDYTPFFASSTCVVLSLLVSFFRESTRIGPRKFVVALEGATRATLAVTPIAASAAIIYGVITITGLLVKVTSIILGLSGGSLFVAIVLVALMSYFLGMGLPVTASYVLIAALGAPALGELGLTMIAAHMIIFWFSQDSTITPPICMTAIVAARIAKAPPMKTGWQSVLMAKALYLVPFVFAYGNLLDEAIGEILFDFSALALFFYVMPVFMEGYGVRPLRWFERVPYLVSGVLLFIASLGPAAEGVYWLVPGLLIFGAGMAYVVRNKPGVFAQNEGASTE